MTPSDDVLDFEAAERAVSLDVDAILARGRARSRRGRLAMAGAVAAALVVVAGIAVSRPSPGGSVAASERYTVPCDKPTRVVPRYLDWPCPTGTVTPYFQAQVTKLVTQARVSAIYRTNSNSYPDAPHVPVRVRVLAFGPQPEGTPGTTLMVAEYWRATGTSPAQIEVLHSAPDGSASTDRLWVPVAGDPPLIAIAANLVRLAPGSFHLAYPKLTPCEQLRLHPPVAPADTAVTCGRTVVAGSDVATVRLLRGPGRLGPPVLVRNRIAAVPEARRARLVAAPFRAWKIEAFSSGGRLLGSVPYTAAVYSESF